MKANKFAIVFLIFGLLLSSCKVSPPSNTGATNTTPGEQTASPTLKLVLLPILDALPIYVAQAEGYFKQEGVEVEFVAANSAVERDQIMAAGQADGMINDLVSVVLYDRDQVQIQVVRFARTATPTESVYKIIASPKSNIQTVNDLKGVEIGISQGSVIEYVTDRLLEADGFSEGDIKTIAVPKISDRLTLLSTGGIQAATLPDPFSTQAIQDGGISILDDTSHPEYGNSVISFRKEIIDSHPEEISGFLKAIDRAVTDINVDPTGWRDILKENNLLPEALLDSYVVPPFPAYSLPTQAQFEDVVSWAKSKGLITGDIAYDSVMYKGQ